MHTAAFGQHAPPNTFAELQLDRAAEHRENHAWLAQHESDPSSRFLLLDTSGRLWAGDGGPCWLSQAQRKALPAITASLLGLADGHAWFALYPEPATLTQLNQLLGHGHWHELRSVGLDWSPFAAGLFAYARALGNWQAITRYCATCAAPLTLHGGGHRATCTNTECGRQHFPRTDPAIITLVEHDGACLLGRQTSWPAGRWSTLAGFVEPGETLEGAVRREVHEEAGITVGACRYFASQPWPFPASLMVGFVASALDTDITLIDGELEAARWFTPEQLVQGIRDGSFLPSSRISVSWQLLAWWLRERAGIDLASVMTATQT